MKKLILSIFAAAGFAATAMAQNGSIGAGEYKYESALVISNLQINVGMSSNLVAGGQWLLTAFDIHGSSQTIGAFYHVESPVSQTNEIVVGLTPATKYSGPGSFNGWLLATNNSVSLRLGNYAGATNNGYASVTSTNFSGADSIFVTSLQSTNATSIGTNSAVFLNLSSYY